MLAEPSFDSGTDPYFTADKGLPSLEDLDFSDEALTEMLSIGSSKRTNASESIDTRRSMAFSGEAISCDFVFPLPHEFPREYQRNNKRKNGERLLRCYPRCLVKGHNAHGYCGTSIKVHVSHPAPMAGIQAFAEFHPLVDWSSGSELHVFHDLPMTEVNSRIQTKKDPLKPWYRGIPVSMTSDDNITACTTFEFNGELRGWNHAENKTSERGGKEDSSYVLRVLVYKQVGIRLQLMCVVNSPSFTIFNRQRAKFKETSSASDATSDIVTTPDSFSMVSSPETVAYAAPVPSVLGKRSASSRDGGPAKLQKVRKSSPSQASSMDVDAPSSIADYHRILRLPEAEVARASSDCEDMNADTEFDTLFEWLDAHPSAPLGADFDLEPLPLRSSVEAGYGIAHDPVPLRVLEEPIWRFRNSEGDERAGSDSHLLSATKPGSSSKVVADLMDDDDPNAGMYEESPSPAVPTVETADEGSHEPSAPPLPRPSGRDASVKRGVIAPTAIQMRALPRREPSRVANPNGDADDECGEDANDGAVEAAQLLVPGSIPVTPERTVASAPSEVEVAITLPGLNDETVREMVEKLVSKQVQVVRARMCHIAMAVVFLLFLLIGTIAVTRHFAGVSSVDEHKLQVDLQRGLESYVLSDKCDCTLFSGVMNEILACIDRGAQAKGGYKDPAVMQNCYNTWNGGLLDPNQLVKLYSATTEYCRWEICQKTQDARACSFIVGQGRALTSVTVATSLTTVASATSTTPASSLATCEDSRLFAPPPGQAQGFPGYDVNFDGTCEYVRQFSLCIYSYYYTGCNLTCGVCSTQPAPTTARWSRITPPVDTGGPTACLNKSAQPGFSPLVRLLR